METSNAAEHLDANETEIATAAVGQRVRTARRERGLTLEDLGGGTLSRSFLSRVENGKTRISLKSLHKIATRLQLPMSHFLEGAIGPAEAPLEITLDEAESSLAQQDAEGALLRLSRVSVPGKLQHRLLYIRGRALNLLERHREAMETLQTARDFALQHDDSHALLEIECALGAALFGIGVYDEAQVHFRTVLNGGQGGIEDPALLGKALAGIGNVFYVRGDVPSALDYYSRAREYMRTVNDPDTAGRVYSALSQDYLQKSDLGSAVRHSSYSVGSYRLKQNAWDAARELATMAVRYLDDDDLDKAAESAQDAASLAVAIGDSEDEAFARSALAGVYLRQGNPDLAAQEANRALGLDAKSLPARSDSMLVLGRIAAETGEFDAANRYYADVVNSLRGTEHQLRFADAAIEYSRFLHKRGDIEAAYSLMLEATEKHRQSFD
jgi:tetratricopeptide (TPR) repeat protein